MDKELLERIEDALDIILYGWQRKYLLRETMYDFDLSITGKGTGKTLAWILRQLCENVEEPLYLRNRDDTMNYCDWWSISPNRLHVIGTNYPNFYKGFLLEVREKLEKEDIPVRDVIL